MKSWLLLCLLTPCWLSATSVVVNTSVPLDALTQPQLRGIFTMRQTQWPDGSPITVVILPASNELHQRFSREQLRLFPYQLNNIWDKLSFSGIGNRPVVAEDFDAMLRILSNTPGSIGYIEQQSPDAGLKELRIDY
ncbi:substrate-binding domain-containing protein [Rheinheimera baltica]|uniref:Substrate-binding domain-containing protein n=1 Tax=Rheinheimera baltica TaxID=67576 RepID=A0ABT9HXB7_9GAMM|nr:substrate-binding domain-containing protein [Rheinheimera baltica]MDP5135772.1 substrate-binding domain-containing protein [Rheinheimera baltica]MDP5188600.1 substrate-binding domain-containing protein [Rheinheimera baltica]